ncbi:MAG: hypothetical protein IKM21_02460 [Oscillospiraceae bacterium]|nr:hypothetical protein [Oscillospiraceae bacterium]
MIKRISFLILTVAMLFSLSACFDEPEYLSGTAPATVDVQPIPIDPAAEFMYDSTLSLADSFNQMNSLRASICEDMYSAVVSFSDSSAWVPIEANKYSLGSDEFLAVSYIMEIAPSVTTKKLMREDGFTNIDISQLDVENSWLVTAKKEENGVVNNYEYTVRYGKHSDSYRFTLTINNEKKMMLASRRITGGYAVQVWIPEGEYHILAHDVKEGRFGYIPKSRDVTSLDFPENDIFYDGSLVTSTFTTANAEHTFLLANNILYITKDGNNYAVPLA